MKWTSESRPARLTSWHEVFENTNPVELEVGPGKGSFLLSAARENENRNFFGVEFSGRRAYRIAELIERYSLTNAIAVAADINCVLRHLVEASSVATIHIYFPDPWWKRRHHRRRLFGAVFCNALSNILLPGGKILLATDVFAYFQQITERLDRVPALSQFEWQRDQRDKKGNLIRTDFERQFLKEGRPIHYAGFIKEQ